MENASFLKEKSEIGALLATLMTRNFVCELFDFPHGTAYSVSWSPSFKELVGTLYIFAMGCLAVGNI